MRTLARVRQEIGLSYDDVLLVPKKGVLDVRADADISTTFVDLVTLDIPILSAPMTSVTEEAMAIEMSRLGGMGVLHRFSEDNHRLDMVEEVSQQGVMNTTVAIGLQDSMMCLDDLRVAGANIFVLDVAHAHSQRVFDYISQVNHFFGSDVMLIVGNVATAEAARDLLDLHVDGIKVGIGPGSACSTREVTGFGVPQLTAVMEVAEAVGDQATVIADGGIKNSGDIVKALAAGADSVMIGKLLAGADEAPYPGDYFGMASKRVNGHKAPEGVEGHVERTGPVAETIKQLTWGIRSGISYAGATNLQELRDNAEFIRVAPGVSIESGTRL